MQWISHGAQWENTSLWALYPSPEDGTMPSCADVRFALDKFAPGSLIEHYDERAAHIRMPITVENTTRSSIGLELRRLAERAA